MPDIPQMVCHRGANRLAPENTLAAARAAYEQGAAYVEIDVRTSADGELFVIHDPTVDRTTDAAGPFADLTAAQVAALDAGAWFGRQHAGERIPTLAHSVECAVAHGGGLYVEVKAADAAAVVATVRGHGLADDRVFYWSGDPALFAALHALGVPTMIRRKDHADTAAAIAHYRPAVMEFEPQEIAAADFAACRANGVAIMAFYGGDDPEVFRQVIGAGIDLFNLDAVEVFQEIAREA